MSKKILFVVPYVPNLIRVRPFNLIRSLSRLGHEVTLLTLWTDEQEQASIKQLEPYVQRVVDVHLPRWRSMWNCLAALPTKKPLQTVYAWEPELAREIFRLTQSWNGKPAFDVVHVEHLRGAHYGLYLKSLFNEHSKSLPIVWDSVDSISLLFRQAMVRSKSFFSRGLTRFELSRTEPYEGFLLRQFDRVTVTSPADKRALLDLVQDGKPAPSISVIPNGVDLDYFRVDDRVERERDTLVISGKMSYHANVSMVLYLTESIMPRVWAERPGTRVLVVGKDPGREIQSLDAHPNITVTGTVDHLPPYLQRAAVAVAPIAYGVGIQNKVLEAMACATPVVATTQAVSAIEAKPGQDVLVADDPQAFAQAILHLLNHDSQRAAVGQAGRRYVESYHHWDNIASRLEAVYTGAVQDGS